MKAWHVSDAGHTGSKSSSAFMQRGADTASTVLLCDVFVEAEREKDEEMNIVNNFYTMRVHCAAIIC